MKCICISRPQWHCNHSMCEGDHAKKLEDDFVLGDVLRTKELSDQHLVSCKNDKHCKLNGEELQPYRQQWTNMLFVEIWPWPQLWVSSIEPQGERNIGQHQRQSVRKCEIIYGGACGLSQGKHEGQDKYVRDQLPKCNQ